MSYERALKFLESVDLAKERARHAQGLVLEIESFLDVQGFDPGKERVSGSRGGGELADQLHRLYEHRLSLADSIDEWLAHVRRVEHVIGSISDVRYVRCLNMHYLEKMEWLQVAKALHYSESGVRVWRRPALEALERALDEYEKNRS